VRNSSKEEAYIMETIIKGKGKGKAIPLQAWTSPEVSRRFKLPVFKTLGA